MVISHLASPFNLLCVERYQRVNYDHACPSVVDFAQFCFQLSWAPENCFIHLNVTQNEIMLKGLSWQLIFWHKVSWLQIWFYEIWKWFLDACYVYIFKFILIICMFISWFFKTATCSVDMKTMQTSGKLDILINRFLKLFGLGCLLIKIRKI